MAGHHLDSGLPKFFRTTVAGNVVFLSGSVGLNKETITCVSDALEEQMVVALDGLRLAMEEAGSSMNNIIKTLILVPDLEDYSRMRKTELEYYQKHAPQRYSQCLNATTG